ncbi:FGFR1 oncogene partner 2 homolog [Drosophila tropicalis]|uniref:FGFR1 oncogene partner 2 homolog n=1 Tax=Drosophila tropicalis TaxID=46794 RepID=UPI0035ABD68A
MKSSKQNVGVVKRLMDLASYLSNSLNDLNALAANCIEEGWIVDAEIQNSSKFREDHLVKYLVDRVQDDEQLQLLRVNVQLKRTVDEYQLGVERIMAKYKEHCESEVLNESFNLREKYISDLSKIVQAQDARIQEMANLMLSCAVLVEHDSVENQEIMRQLVAENEQMRYQLQISNAMKQFVQGSKPSTESGTQFNENDLDSTSESNSCSSLESFITCLSSGCESASTESSVISQIEVNRFIEQALADVKVEAVDKDDELDVVTEVNV